MGNFEKLIQKLNAVEKSGKERKIDIVIEMFRSINELNSLPKEQQVECAEFILGRLSKIATGDEITQAFFLLGQKMPKTTSPGGQPLF